MGNTFDDDVFLLSRDEDEEKEAKSALFLFFFFLFATITAEQTMGKEEVIFACFKKWCLRYGKYLFTQTKRGETCDNNNNERTNERTIYE
jgi:hypothetical protein